MPDDSACIAALVNTNAADTAKCTQGDNVGLTPSFQDAFHGGQASQPWRCCARLLNLHAKP